MSARSYPPQGRFGRATVAYANYRQFGAREQVRNPRVQSRMILWCKAGVGEVTVNGVLFALVAGRYMLLPWGHDIAYRAGAGDPFLVAGIHLIPDHHPDHPLVFDVAHHREHALADAPYRRDVSIRELRDVKTGSLHEHPTTLHLFEYIVGLFIRDAPPEWLARHLAGLVFHELLLLDGKHEAAHPGLPLELDRMKQFVLANLHRRLSLRDLVEFSRLSSSTVCRMFRQHLGVTPVSFILHGKMDRARLLLRTRRLTVAEVGDQVGISDPYYFSKCFTKAAGRPPQVYRKETAWI